MERREDILDEIFDRFLEGNDEQGDQNMCV